jgi:hypothetical protein
MGLLTRDQILEADDLPREVVEVPEWGGEVYVAAMTGADRDRFDESIQGRGGDDRVSMENYRARLLARCLVGEDGKRLFSEQDVEALGRKSSAALGRLFSVAIRLNRLRKEDVDELVKNSDGAPSGASGSS